MPGLEPGIHGFSLHWPRRIPGLGLSTAPGMTVEKQLGSPCLLHLLARIDAVELIALQPALVALDLDPAPIAGAFQQLGEHARLDPRDHWRGVLRLLMHEIGRASCRERV